MSEEKQIPIHRIAFSKKQIDADGQEKLGRPVDVGAVWPRKNEKKGGLVSWTLSPKNLGDGAWFFLDTERNQKPIEASQHPSHIISFAEARKDEHGNEKLGKAVEVGVVWPRKEGKQGGMIDWHISPKQLGEGAWFVLENERQQKQSKSKDAFEKSDATKENSRGLSR